MRIGSDEEGSMVSSRDEDSPRIGFKCPCSRHPHRYRSPVTTPGLRSPGSPARADRDFPSSHSLPTVKTESQTSISAWFLQKCFPWVRAELALEG